MSPSLECGVPYPRQLEVARARRASFLLKRMEHVVRFSEPCEVNDTIRAGIIRHPEFFHSRSHRRHRFEVLRGLATLNLFQLVPCIMSHILRKLSEAFQRVPEKAQWFHELIIPVWIYDGKSMALNRSCRRVRSRTA